MNIGLLGFGNVGGTLYGLINRTSFASTSGICVRRVLCRSWREEIAKVAAREYGEILGDGDIDTVVELIGGETPAYGYISEALHKGKNVVTANKAVLSRHYKELLSIAQENGCKLYFSAAVGGGIPWLRNLIRAAHINEIDEVHGIMNGTSNFILDSMLKESAEFEDALREAQEMGLAESDPTQDIDGFDAAAKLAISASIAFGAELLPSGIAIAGIRSIKREDVDLFFDRGLSCKLVSRAKKVNGSVVAYVEPTLCEEGSAEHSIAANGNHLTYHGDLCGEQSFFGEGAGKNPTAQNVLRDIVDLSEGTDTFGEVRRSAASLAPADVDNSLERHRYYVRTSAFETAEKFFGAECELNQHNAERAYLTHELSVKDMHEMAHVIKRNDACMFFAGLK